VVSVDLTFVSNQVMSTDLECMHYRGQLWVMGWVILFVGLQLSRDIGYNSSFLHENTT
jgi:hypothetical protein